MAIVARTLSDQVYEVVRDRILVGDLAQGTPVRQDAIAAELGVSKIPLREALSRLEQDGLVGSHPHRGFVVTSLSEAEAEEIYALRLKLEPEAAAQACLAADDADRAEARAALLAIDSVEGEAPVALNRAFHMALVRPGRGLVTLQIIERLHVLAERYVHMHLSPVGRDVRAHREHAELLAAWIERRPDAVQSMTSSHIEATMDDLRRQFAEARRG